MKNNNFCQWIVLVTLVLAFLPACSRFVRTMPAYPRVVQTQELNAKELSIVLDRFYGAANVTDAEAAVATATELAPDAAETHEIAGHFARLKGNESQAWQHFYLAMAVPGNRAAFLHINDLLDIPMTVSEYRETKALFEDILKAHPDESLKQVCAAFIASWRRRLDADPEGAEAALQFRGALRHFALISAFDNANGQGFSVEYPPEREIDYSKEYTGTQLPARWRKDVPLDHQHGLDLGNLVSPGSHVAAYVSTYVSVPKEGEYLLNVTTTDAIRIWVNNISMLKQQRVEDETVDQFRVPLVLREGWNHILVKSCHERGSWRLGLTVTEPNGALVKKLKSSAGPETVEDGPAPGDGYSLERDLNRQLNFIEEPLRKKYYGMKLAGVTGLVEAVENKADQYRSIVPSGLFSRLESAMAAWDAGQLGLTIDILDALIVDNGDKAPWLFVLRAEYFDEQNRSDRTRDDLLAAIEANPSYRTAHNRMVEHYADQGWTEDYLIASEDNIKRWPDNTSVLWLLAHAYSKLGRRQEAERVYRTILGYWNGASDILKKMVELSLLNSDYKTAIQYQEKLIKLFPNTPNAYLNLGDILRRAGRFDEAVTAYQASLKIDNQWSRPVKRLGALAYERGNVDEAVSLWKRSIKLEPDDHSLADRLEFIAPEDNHLFDEFVPDIAGIKQIIAGVGAVQVHPGSDVVYLLDHAVEQMEMDGSSRQIVTQILTAANDTGRDKLTSHTLPRGRLRVKEAYVVDPDGSRYEASSIRGHEVRFRDLKVGSAVVLQYRLDSYPGGYLSRHLSRRWFFHGPRSQFEDSHYVLFVPLKMKLNEMGHGIWTRKEEIRSDRRIVEYQAKQVAPFVAEPYSPHIVDLLDQVVLSSVPDWETIAGWDAALLVNAFRSTPKTKKRALSLTRDAKTKKEKLDAITRFVMREIRYQQDYENTIAGVKPHAASVVLQRAYGDCKDKSVLLMTLAGEVGIDTRFALLRTTSAGSFIKDLPSLQFNHAIVYVPEQDGFESHMFIDATPDTLDLKTLRPDSQNTWAMVIEPSTGAWQFIRTPVVAANQQYTLRRIRMSPKVDEKSSVEITLSFQGPAAAAVRSILRNPDTTRVFYAQLANSFFPSSQVEDASFSGEDDISRPVTMRMTISSDGIARHQGDTVIIELPKAQNLSKFIGLSERRLPLKMGLFRSLAETEDVVTIPNGYAIAHVPEEIQVDNPFFSFERKVEQDGQDIKLKVRFVEKTLLIDPKAYPEFRAQVTKIVENLEQDLVLKPTGKSAKK